LVVLDDAAINERQAQVAQATAVRAHSDRGRVATAVQGLAAQRDIAEVAAAGRSDRDRDEAARRGVVDVQVMRLGVSDGRYRNDQGKQCSAHDIPQVMDGRPRKARPWRQLRRK